MRKTIIAAALVLPALASGATAGDLIIGQASVMDGDTIEIHGTRIRLHGIDAPESRQVCKDAKGAEYRCGQKAASVLDFRISDAAVFCEPLDKDRYGRTIARCRAWGEDLSAWMAGLGWALAYRRYSEDYVPAEELARTRRAGLWAGTFTPPWDWRRGQR